MKKQDKLKIAVTGQDKILILGRTGSGKTLLVKSLIPSIDRVLVWDPMDEYKSISKVFFDPLSLYYFFTTKDLKNFCVRFVTDDMNNFDKICRLVYCMSNMTFIIEEASLICGSGPREIPEYFSKLIIFGRRWDQSLIYTTQRPPQIHKLLPSQASKIVSFRQHQESDLDYLKSYMPIKELQTLPDLGYIVYDSNRGEFTTGQVFAPS